METKMRAPRGATPPGPIALFAAAIALAAAAIGFVACSGGSAEDETENARSHMEKAAEEMKAAGKDMQDAGRKLAESLKEAVKGDEGSGPADFEDLQALLPAKLPDMVRKEASGQRTGGFGVSIATAEADYENDSGGRIHITLSDNKLAGAFGTFAWSLSEFSKESDAGYEKTMKYEGNPGYEKYENATRHGEISVLVGGRFLVLVTGDGVEMKQIKRALDRIDIGKLEHMNADASSSSGEA